MDGEDTKDLREPGSDELMDEDAINRMLLIEGNKRQEYDHEDRVLSRQPPLPPEDEPELPKEN